MTCIPSTPYSRDLGDELRALREKHTRHNGSWMAELLGWDQSKISNIENGKQRASEIDIVQYLTRCGLDRDFIEDFLDRYRRAFDTYFVQVSQNMRTMVMAESTADRITSYSVEFIPGLLQTKEYAQAVFEAVGMVPEEQIEGFVRSRIERQAILRRHDRPQCTFYVRESTLRMRVGSEVVMYEQLKRLLFRTHIIRILPESNGPVGLFTSNYTLWGYEKAASVAYTESDIAKVFAQEGAAVTTLKRIFARLDQVAMDAGQSRQLLADLVSDLRKDLHGSGDHVA